MQNDQTFDIIVIGGGINGVGIAADAALKGLSVALFEQNDLAYGTSSTSTKLIHGGLRYLEHFEFRLVQESLKERDVLLSKAPNLIYPLSFVLPHDKSLRPKWLIRLGLYLYDFLANSKRLPRAKAIQFNQAPEGHPLKPHYKYGFTYSDCWVDDARLVVLNALFAQSHGAQIKTRTKVTHVNMAANHWEVHTTNSLTGQSGMFKAKVLVNASGPWVGKLSKDVLHEKKPKKILMVKGSHIITKKLYDGEHAYLLQSPDKRIIFTIPYLSEYTLIGTTDVPYNGELDQITISDDEVNYLLDIVKTYFNEPLAPSDVISSYSGVRPLMSDELDNPSKASRDYELELIHSKNHPALLTVLGGKLTTYRKLAEHALAKLTPFFSQADTSKSTAKTLLPGGDIPHGDFELFLKTLKNRYTFLPAVMAMRFARSYGTLTYKILDNKTSLDELGPHFGATLYQAEVDYLCDYEMAVTAEDILWRRTKLGLTLDEQQVSQLEEYLTLKLSQT